MSPETVSALNHISTALWVIAIVFIIGTIALGTTLYLIIKLLGKINLLVDELKAHTRILSGKLDPLIVSATEAFKDIKNASQKLNVIITNLTDIGSSIAGIIGFFNVFNLFSKRKAGFFTGIKAGLDIMKNIKSKK